MRRFDPKDAVAKLVGSPGIFVAEEFLDKATVARIKNLALSYEVDAYNGVRGLLEKIDDLEDILFHPDVFETCRRLFQVDFRLGSFDIKATPPQDIKSSQKAIVRKHIDYPGPNMVRLSEGESNRFHGLPLALKLFIPLTDLNRQAGATQYIPNSHLWHRDPEIHGSEFEVRMEQGETCSLEVKAGTLAMWSGPIWHADLENKSSHVRVLTHICIVPKFVIAPHAVPEMLSPEYVDRSSPRMREILGVSDLRY